MPSRHPEGAGSRGSERTVKRANRLLIVGIIVTVVGAGLVGLVLLVERPPVRADTQTETTPPEAEVVADAEDGQDDAVFDPREPVLEHLGSTDDVEAVALTVDFESSVAGLPQVGDRVHVYGIPEPDENQGGGTDGSAPADEVADDGTADEGTAGDEADSVPLAGSVERLLTDVLVLGITGAVHEGNSGTPTLIVAVPADQVAGALSAHRYESVHVTLVAGPEEDTVDEDDEADSGVDGDDAQTQADA